MKKFILFILLPIVISAKPIVFSEISKTLLNTGDTLTLKIVLRDTLKHKYVYPMNDTTFGDFILIKTEEKNDSNHTEINFKLLFKGIDKDSIPAFNIYYGKNNSMDTILTPVIYTSYKSLVNGDSTEGNIKSDKPQALIKHNLLFYFILLLFVVLIILTIIFTVYYLRKKLRKNKHIEETEFHSLKETVINMLTGIEIPDLSNDKGIREFYYRLSYILRYFVDGNFRTNTMDMTSSEFIKTLRELNIDKADIKKVKENIDRFDMIKYASDTGRSKLESDLNFVKSFVNNYYIQEKPEEKGSDESSGK